MRDAVIVEAVRTPVGKGRPSGALAGVHSVDLFAHAIRAVVERSGIDPALVDDVIGGCVDQVAEQAMNTTRYAALAAGLPEQVPATTVDRQCGSSQQAVHFAAQGVIAGAYDVVIAGGVESMSRVPMWSNVPEGSDPFGPGIAARYPEGLIPQAVSAELVAVRWGLERDQLDELALASHQRAHSANTSGLFDREIAPIKAPAQNGTVTEVTRDEGIRPNTSLEALAALPSAFHDQTMAALFPEIGWNITAGNSSQISDGSAALLITTSERAAELGLRPRARIHTTTVVGDDPLLMLTAVIPATRKVLHRAGLTLADIDLFEVNEAFSSVVLAWLAETGADPARVNRHGGAIALGHPLGASGARIMTTLVNALEQRDARFGLQTMCEAGGLANATVLERL